MRAAATASSHSAASSAHFSARGRLGDRYHRVHPALPEEIALDDVSKVPLLKALADSHDLTSTIDWIQTQLGAARPKETT